MTAPERLAAYLADDLDPAEKAAVEAELARDPELRRTLEAIRAADEALAALPEPEPSAAFSARLRAAVAEEIERQPVVVRDELAIRRVARRRSLAPLAAAAAAAAVISLVGVSTGWLLRGGVDDSGVAMDSPEIAALDADAEPEADSLRAPGEAVPTVPIIATANDYGELELRRLAVNVETQFTIHHDATAETAGPLADMLIGRLLRTGAAQLRSEGHVPPDPSGDPVSGCLPSILADAQVPLVPVFVELAAYEGTDAVIFVFVTEEPESGTFRRIDVRALSRADCAELATATYDR